MSARYIRYIRCSESIASYGLLNGDRITRLSGPPWGEHEEEETFAHDKEVVLKAPVEPSKVICIGLNYHAHVAASYSADKAPERPLIFLKPPSSIIGTNESVVHPDQTERVDYEAELGIVIGKRARKVSVDEADNYIFGLTCVNDVTARDLQKADGQWSRAKGFDSFCPVGPWIITGVDYADLLVEGILNGETKQSGRTTQMIFSIEFIISYISSIMTLNPGDLISTGTPSGIGPMKPGDNVEVRIEKVGSLVNSVTEE